MLTRALKDPFKFKLPPDFFLISSGEKVRILLLPYRLTTKHKGSSDNFFHNLPPKILLSGKTNGLRKDSKAGFLMSRIVVIVNYKGFEEFCKIFITIFNKVYILKRRIFEHD